MPIGSNGHFSQAVWGDKTVIAEGVEGRYNTTSNVHSLFGQNPVKKIDRVSAAQWDRIIATARTYIVKGPEPKPHVTLPPAPLETQSDEDWELPDIDPDTLSTSVSDAKKSKEPETTTLVADKAESKGGMESNETVTDSDGSDSDEAAQEEEEKEEEADMEEEMVEL